MQTHLFNSPLLALRVRWLTEERSGGVPAACVTAADC